MQNAKIDITDIAYENGLYIVGIKVKAEGYEFKKAYRIVPDSPVDVKHFKENIRKDIIEEVRRLKAIEPIKALQGKEFNLEYGDDNKTNDNG